MFTQPLYVAPVSDRADSRNMTDATPFRSLPPRNAATIEGITPIVR